MKKRIVHIILILMLLTVSIVNAADITVPYSTEFDCAEQDQLTVGWPTCDDVGLGFLFGWIEVKASDGVTNQWTQVGATNEWFYTGSDTELSTEPRELMKNFDLQSVGTVGSLSEGQWDWASSTIYIYSTVDPDGEVDGYITANVVHSIAEPGDYVTQITTPANNPLGTGRGLRFWLGDGSIVNTAPVVWNFATKQTELYIRFYIRYEEGFQWEDSLTADKILYMYTEGGTDQIFEFVFNDGKLAFTTQSVPVAYQLITPAGVDWSSLIGGGTVSSDGGYHCMEIYMKMDTDGTDVSDTANGAGRILFDGVMVAENLAMNYSDGLAASKEGWDNFRIKTNSNSPRNGGPMTVDYDSLRIETTATSLCNDGDGNFDIPCIGPITTATTPTSLAGIISKGVEHK